MAHPEYRGKDRHGRDRWRVKWPRPGEPGKYDSASHDDHGEPFLTEKAAQDYGDEQEREIRKGRYKDPRRGQITFKEWSETWYDSLDLERSTMRKYKRMLKGHIMKRFGHLALVAIAPEMVGPWERSIVAAGYKPRTAKDARATLITVLNAAKRAGHIDTNPAERVRGTGRKGRSRVEEWEQAEKVWPTPFQALIIAERVAVLSGRWTDFLLVLLAFYTGARWSEAIAVTPEAVKDRGIVHLHWKIYETEEGDFYWGRPKDGSIRDVHVPMWLWEMLQLAAAEARRCGCTVPEDQPHDPLAPWCDGSRRVLFLTSSRHHSRSDFRRLYLRPAADGWYPERGGTYGRDAKPVLADASRHWPGVPLAPWAAAEEGKPFAPWPTPEAGKPWERPRMLFYRQGWGPKEVNSRSARAALAAYAVAQGADEAIVARMKRDALLDAYVRPCPDALVQWTPVCTDLTFHGTRHGHQTMMDNGGLKKAFKVSRMGHTDGSMSANYGHVTAEMISEGLDLFTRLWESSLQRRFELSPRSMVPVLDAALGVYRDSVVTPLFSQNPPKNERGRLSS
ncbi:hypothetical protein HII36_42985 [Nonomuraea sp. NN258]|uniref:phage integrase central domain-containing protein n=1 Tax=Nonomuraea antri TaxID=2730852 RepID=UPI001569C592|nr:hypothetical protein [Nonomuraea antri]NRQ38544.1 hypothetical protein [Nonomuraea antri]